MCSHILLSNKFQFLLIVMGTTLSLFSKEKFLLAAFDEAIIRGSTQASRNSLQKSDFDFPFLFFFAEKPVVSYFVLLVLLSQMKVILDGDETIRKVSKISVVMM